MLTKEFDYELPKELIAQEPLIPRDSSRLLVVHRSQNITEHKVFHHIIEYLRPGDVLVLNNTRVMPARLYGFKKDTGAKIEILVLQRLGLNQIEALVRPGRKIKLGAELVFGEEELKAKVVDYTVQGGRILDLKYEGIFEDVLEKLGRMPLPPYISKELKNSEQYQTVYGQHWGSAAAPTAGLHFTRELLSQVENKGVKIVKLVLHVGLGTFRPVEVNRVEDHEMHREYFSLDDLGAQCLNEAKSKGNRIIAVGTTTVRVLETLANKEKEIKAGEGWTDIFIYPGYEFKAIDGLITNFHLPKSTLLMLVSAFAGRELIRQAYAEAIEAKYRFYSFGDGMLIL